MAKGEGLPTMLPASKKKRSDDDPLPSDVGQKPIQLQRRRVWRACESCRRKKIKCDGCEPTCSQCTSSGSQCTWLQTKDRAALSRHYVQELEARLMHMESLFTQIAPVLEQLGPLADGAPISSIAPPGSVSADKIAPTVPAALLSLTSKGHQQSFEPSTSNTVKTEEDVTESFGELALDEYGHMRWIGGSSTMSLIQSFKALVSSPLHRISPMEEDPHAPGPSVNKLYFPAAVFFGKIRALPGPEDVEYPVRDLADKLVEAYFAKFHFLMPVIDKPSFLQKYQKLMDNTHDHVLARSETAFLSLVFAVFACAANLVQDPRLATSDRNDDGGMGMVYYERALILQYISHPNIQIFHVQCFTLLSSFLCSINCLPQAWILLGQAVRTGQDLGLHRSPRRLLVTSIEKETRRKTWWSVYILDRMLALALGRPLGINDSDCDVEMPVEVIDEYLPVYFSGAPITQRQPSLMCGIVHMIKLYEIAGRLLRQVYAIENCKDNLESERRVELQKSVEALDNELQKWCDDLQPAFKSQSETDEQVSMGVVLCSHYYCIVTTLHRSFIPVRPDQMVTPKSTAKAVSSARSSIRLASSMKHVVPPSHHLAFFIQNLFSSAVILLLYAMHSNDGRAANQAMEEAKSTLAALEAWEGTWPGARKCKELLTDLVMTANDAIAQGRTNDNVSGSTVEKSNGLSGAEKLDGPPLSSSPIGPSRTERRKSVTVVTNTSSRTMKTRTRRNRSRDANGGPGRRLSAISPYRVDGASRARSTSRRRALDDSKSDGDRSCSLSYYQSFSSPTTVTSTIGASQHSSPASNELSSPAMSTVDPPELSPRLSNTFTSFNSTVAAASPSSPLHYEFNAGSSPLNPSQTSTQQWNGNRQDRPMDICAQEATMYNSFGFGSPMDGGYPGYEIGSDTPLPSSSTTPPTSSFPISGLPFPGLDYIRNYNPGGFNVNGEQDWLWHSYDPHAFGVDPDIPFSIGGGGSELADSLS